MEHTRALTFHIFNEHLPAGSPPITVCIILYYITCSDINYRLLFQRLLNADSIIMPNLMWIIQKSPPNRENSVKRFVVFHGYIMLYYYGVTGGTSP